VRLRTPRPAAPNIEKLREALVQRAEDWRAILRSEPKVARLMLRRLVEPLEMTDESDRPEWLKLQAPIKPALLDGLIHDVASPTGLNRLYFERPLALAG
jgi:hypothetical protein